jgi:serine/threonine-protein kinase RsbW
MPTAPRRWRDWAPEGHGFDRCAVLLKAMALREAELSVATSLADVAAATQRLRDMLPDWLEEAERDTIELALAEAMTNIVRHGYGGDTAEKMRVRVLERPGALEIDVWDKGKPIPPGKLESTDVTTSFSFDPTHLDSLPEGGMGLALIKSAFDDLRYTSRGGVNRLHLVRRI